MNWSKLNSQSGQYRQNPPDDTWNKIDFLLSSSPEKKIKPWTAWVKYAAVLFLITGSIWLLNRQNFSGDEAPAFEVVQIEQTVSPIYTSQNIVALKAAYAKAGVNTVTRSKSGL